MPLIHIRNINQDLSVPYPLLDEKYRVMNTLADQLHGVKAEMRILPPGFDGDVTPHYWRTLGNMSCFMVKVAPEGEPERADVRILSDYKWITDELPPNQPIPGVESPFDATKLPEVGSIDEEDPILIIGSITIDQRILRIGGVVVLGAPDLVPALTHKLPLVSQ
ncbi:MAG TPA: hypothetical protein VF733_06795 [Candidatus Saccharimonadales bacterium]